MNIIGYSIVEAARTLAHDAHEGQVRKYTDEPYVTHPEAVAKLVAQFTDDPDIIAAALLHDVIEDTDYTYDDILLLINPRVAHIVLDLTDRYTHEWYPDKNREERKLLEARRLRGVSWEAKLVKMCDIMDNMSSIEAADDGFKKKWVPEKYRAVRALLGGPV